jgi:hypothetical protein
MELRSLMTERFANGNIPYDINFELSSIEDYKEQSNAKVRLLKLYRTINKVEEVVQEKIKTIDEPYVKPVVKPILKKVEIIEPMDEDEIDDRDPDFVCRENDFIPVARFNRLSAEEQEKKINELVNDYDYFLGGYRCNLEDEIEELPEPNNLAIYKRIIHYRNRREEEINEAIGAEEDDDPFDNKL